MFDLVVTRHQGLIQWLLDNYIITHDIPVLSHVTDPSQLTNQNVVGVLPLHLIPHCRSYAAVNLNTPAHLRGQDLTADQVASLDPTFSFFRVMASDPIAPLDLITRHADRITDLHISNFGSYPTSGQDATAQLANVLIDDAAYADIDF